uniref:Uncharacterized protein n=1 Tax=Timema bartmani TaxID=61472 RepID=A0A7R9I7L0_9NEOP|nr:unnamed protein product [Timema bartmani]
MCGASRGRERTLTKAPNQEFIDEWKHIKLSKSLLPKLHSIFSSALDCNFVVLQDEKNKTCGTSNKYELLDKVVVLGVEQIEDEMQIITKKEFEEFQKKLRETGKEANI